MPRPVLDATAGDISGADYHVVVLHGANEVRQVLRVVAVVTVHREYEVIAVVDGEPEPSQVGAPQSQLCGTAEKMQVGVSLSGSRYDFTGSVRAVVVDDENVDVLVVSQDLFHERENVLRFVVSR